MRKPAAGAGIALLLILALLLGLRAALPGWISNRVNRPPADSARFRWEVKDVDVRILSLSYEFEGVTLRKRGSSAPTGRRASIGQSAGLGKDATEAHALAREQFHPP